MYPITTQPNADVDVLEIWDEFNLADLINRKHRFSH